MTLTKLLKRMVGRPRPRLALPITFYTRQGCHCCEKALAVLECSSKRLGFALEINLIDIDTDPELRAQYDTQVPVIVIDGKERFRGVVNEVLLERLLLAMRRKS